MTKSQEKVFTQQSLRPLAGRIKSKPDDLAVLARIGSAGLLDKYRAPETRLSSYSF